MTTLLVTGGAGFIGSAFVRQRTAAGDRVVTVDKLTYAGHRASLAPAEATGRHEFVQADIGDGAAMLELLRSHRPDAVVNFAAETHVDRSIDGPAAFVDTNVVGTFRLLEAARQYHQGGAEGFRLLHVSTDEVYGSLGPTGKFTETTPYAPNSPYSASKAASDHFVRAYFHTFGLPVLTTNCTNNYGPYQFPEKLIPLMVLNALEGKPLPVYGDGSNVRDWLFVDDHCEAIHAVLRRGTPGEVYNVGGDAERTNMDIVGAICALVDELADPPHKPCQGLVEHVTDRPGHDARYAMDIAKIGRELDWKPRVSFEDGLRRTVQWYLDNDDWIQTVTAAKYDRQRLGLKARAG